MYIDYIRINFDKKTECADGYSLSSTVPVKELAANGIENVVLTGQFFNNEFNFETIEYRKTELVTTAIVYFSSNEKRVTYI